MNSKPKVYIADLRHVEGGLVSNSVMPLGIGYMKAVMDRDFPAVESRVFSYPDHLLEVLKTDSPDVLMLTNYVWNEHLSRYCSKVMKRLRPEGLVVAGGPNIPLEKERQIKFMENWKDLDVYALGEGDFLAMEITKRFLDAGKSVAKFVKYGVPSSLCRMEGRVIHQPMWERNLELEQLPSPWLTGTQDHFFDGKLIPLIETNRGCPFKCTYCVQGTGYYNRLKHFDEDQVKEELTYIARRVKQVCPNIGALTIADPNFGMYKRDVDLSEHIGSLQQEYSWPSYVDCSTGKNAPELVIKSIEKTNGALSMLHAVQSMDGTVLGSIKRSNIKLDTYEKVTKHLSVKGIRTFSQTILALPMETIQTHLAGLRLLIDNEIDSLQNFQLMLLKGAEIESQESRNEFGFESKFRVSPRCFGIYNGDPVFDVEEIVTSTNTFSFDDYIEARKYHLGYMVFWGQDWFNDLFYYARNLGVQFSTCAEAMVEAMSVDDGLVGKFMMEFVEETRGELFLTPEDCFQFYAEEQNLMKLKTGEIGDNLLNKYRAIASFLLWPQVLQLAVKVVKGLIVTHASDKLDPEFDQFWEDFCHFIDAKHASGQSVDEILSPVNCQLRYDIPRWVVDWYPNSISQYRLDAPQNFLFRLSEMGASEIKNAIDTWSTDLSGLTKVARHLKVTSQVRQC